MAKKKADTPTPPAPPAPEAGIGYLAVQGFKSILNEQSIEIRPLTLLAGANSSGKSSIMQGLLLMKQTLEASYDPGALLLDGPNLRITSVDQVLARKATGKALLGFSVSVGDRPDTARTVFFQRQEGRGLEVARMLVRDATGVSELRPGQVTDGSIARFSTLMREMFEGLSDLRQTVGDFEWRVTQDRCFLELMPRRNGQFLFGADLVDIVGQDDLKRAIPRVIHVPGLGGNSDRTYPATAVGSAFPGTFEKYTASVIAQWQAQREVDKLSLLDHSLERLGLTWGIAARQASDTQLELWVGRTLHGHPDRDGDMVNISDVGLGASHSLPMLVALLVAKPGQLVYLEQPELHLHPRAQSALAEVLADAARRGVKVVAETHSDLLILAVQSLVAEGKLAPELVKLHWFQRNAEGVTEIFSADLDENGAYGDWPEDFADVRLRSEDRYLDAVQLRNAGR